MEQAGYILVGEKAAFLWFTDTKEGRELSSKGCPNRGLLVCWLFSGGSYMPGGTFTAGPILNVAVWESPQWKSLDKGTTTIGTNGAVYALVADDNNLYIGGLFPSVIALGVPLTSYDNIAAWNGTGWESVGSLSGRVWALFIMPRLTIKSSS